MSKSWNTYFGVVIISESKPTNIEISTNGIKMVECDKSTNLTKGVGMPNSLSNSNTLSKPIWPHIKDVAATELKINKRIAISCLVKNVDQLPKLMMNLKLKVNWDNFLRSFHS